MPGCQDARNGNTCDEYGHVYEGYACRMVAVHFLPGLLGIDCTMVAALDPHPEEVVPSTNKPALKRPVPRSHAGNRSGKWLSLSVVKHLKKLPFLT
jgi:hypothetical protein